MPSHAGATPIPAVAEQIRVVVNSCTERWRTLATMAPSPSPNPASMFPSILRHPAFACALLLTCSNVFMTFAWYGHLRNLSSKPWWIAALLSWLIALAEYLFQVPANRIGYTELSLGQLKIMQEVITLCVFAPFAVFYMGQPLKLDFLWAGCCMLGAVYFMFRN
jgi:uncharacterized protein